LPLLAGIDERVPWLLQWHNDVDPAYGTKLGDFFRDFVAEEAHRLGIAVGDLCTWTLPAAPKRTTVDPNEVLAALRAWKPDIDEEDDDEEEGEAPRDRPRQSSPPRWASRRPSSRKRSNSSKSTV